MVTITVFVIATFSCLVVISKITTATVTVLEKNCKQTQIQLRDHFHFDRFNNRTKSLGLVDHQVSISSTFFALFFVQKPILAAFSSYILALEKNSYKRRAHITLMKLTTADD